MTIIPTNHALNLHTYVMQQHCNTCNKLALLCLPEIDGWSDIVACRDVEDFDGCFDVRACWDADDAVGWSGIAGCWDDDDVEGASDIATCLADEAWAEVDGWSSIFRFLTNSYFRAWSWRHPCIYFHNNNMQKFRCYVNNTVNSLNLFYLSTGC